AATVIGARARSAAARSAQRLRNQLDPVNRQFDELIARQFPERAEAGVIRMGTAGGIAKDLLNVLIPRAVTLLHVSSANCGAGRNPSGAAGVRAGGRLRRGSA